MSFLNFSAATLVAVHCHSKMQLKVRSSMSVVCKTSSLCMATSLRANNNFDKYILIIRPRVKSLKCVFSFKITFYERLCEKEILLTASLEVLWLPRTARSQTQQRHNTPPAQTAWTHIFIQREDKKSNTEDAQDIYHIDTINSLCYYVCVCFLVLAT